MYILILKNAPELRGDSAYATHKNNSVPSKSSNSPKEGIDRSRGEWVTVLIKQTHLQFTGLFVGFFEPE